MAAKVTARELQRGDRYWLKRPDGTNSTLVQVTHKTDGPSGNVTLRCAPVRTMVSDPSFTVAPDKEFEVEDTPAGAWAPPIR